MQKFKDKCDSCGKFDYLKGIKGKCLCKNCADKIKPINKKQMTIFDFPEVILWV